MSRLTTQKYSSLNKSITSVQNPEAALQEALEYTAVLETVILSLCEELDLDPQELVEGAFTLKTVQKKKSEKTVGKSGDTLGKFRKWDRSQTKRLNSTLKRLGATPAFTDNDFPGYSSRDTLRARKHQLEKEARIRRESGY